MAGWMPTSADLSGKHKGAVKKIQKMEEMEKKVE